MNLYQENILDHYKNPRRWGEIADADQVLEGANISCGDEIRFFLKFDRKNKIADLRWHGRACAICLASASMLAEQLIGQPIAQIKKLTKKEILANLGIDLSPIRLKCALLPLETLKKLEP